MPVTEQWEQRHAALQWPDSDWEIRTGRDGMEFTGYAAVFNSPSEDLGGFRETLMPGVFTKSLNSAANGSADVRMFWDHDSHRPLGSTKANLRLSQDSVGLVAEAKLPETNDGRDMAVLLRDKIVRSMSFGFTVPPKRSDGGLAQEWSQDRTQRVLHEVRLFEVSPVTGWPAYKATSASVRHLMSLVDMDDEESLATLVGSFSDEQRMALARHLGVPTPTPHSDELAELYARLERKRAA